MYDADGKWQGNDFVESLSYDLCNHEAEHNVERENWRALEQERKEVECQRKENDGVGTFANDGGEDGSQGEVVGEVAFVAVAHFHFAHDERIEKRADNEGYEACRDNLWGKGEHLFEGNIGSWLDGRQGTRDASEDHDEEVHGEAYPNDKSGFAVAPHFGYDVVEDVGDGKDDETTRQGKGIPNFEYFGFKEIGCHETDTEEDSCQHEGNTHLLLGIFHLFLFFTRFVKHSLVFNVVIWYTPVFLRGNQALGMLPWLISFGLPWQSDCKVKKKGGGVE